MRRAVLAVFVSVATAWAGACSSATQSVTSPSTSKCAVTAVATPASFSAAGGSGTLTLSTNRECQWSVAAASGWIELAGATTGQGAASIAFKVAANADPGVRTATISASDQQVVITQEAAPCVFTVAPRSDSVSASGGQKVIDVAASSPQCGWSARSDVDWLAVLDGAQGTGNGQVRYEARGTSGPARTGTLVVAGETVTVTQSPGCRTSIAPSSWSVAATGGTASVALATEAGCSWSARSNAPWIAITSGQNGSGPGTIVFSVSRSDGPARSGTLTIEGQTFTVSQASGCSYGLVPASHDVDYPGGTGSFAVNTSPGCVWTATSVTPWLTITGATSGTGSGTVNFNVGGNAMGAGARTGTIRVNEQTFTVNQAPGVPCVYRLTTTSQDFSAAAGTGSFVVETVLTCPWSASTNDPWITIMSPGSGAGIGTVHFSVAQNPPGSPARVGTITVRGPIFTITQAAAPGIDR